MSNSDQLTISRSDIVQLLKLKELQTKAIERLKHDTDTDTILILQSAIMHIHLEIKKILPTL
jgi:hypothetical protein